MLKFILVIYFHINIGIWRGHLLSVPLVEFLQISDLFHECDISRTYLSLELCAVVIFGILALRIPRILVFVLRPEFEKLENATFRKLDLFLSSGKERKRPTLLGPLERSSFSQWTTEIALSNGPHRVGDPFPHLRTEIDRVPEMLCFLVFRIPDDGQRPERNNSECHTPQSEPSRSHGYKFSKFHLLESTET
jgi:hypothetical protein